MKRIHFLVFIGVYSLGLVVLTSLFWQAQTRKPVLRDSTCFDSYTCASPGYMATNGVMRATLSLDNEVAMYERIREYYMDSYRALPGKYEAEPRCEGTLEEKEECKLGPLRSALFNPYVVTAKEKEKYEVILASLKKGIDVDTTFSAPRQYKGLDGIVAVITRAAPFVPGVGYVGPRSDFFFFRREGASYRLVGVTGIGEVARTLDLDAVSAFKRGVGEL